MKKTRIEKGITLIALIITIIILLILAVVTIGSIKNSKIITYAQNAADDYEMSKDKETSIITGYESLIESQLPSESKTIYTEENVPIPAGFKFKEGNRNDGLVIENETEGSQFVWVPVSNINNMIMCKSKTANDQCNIELNNEKTELSCKTHNNSTDICGKLYGYITMGTNFDSERTNQTYGSFSVKEPYNVSSRDILNAYQTEFNEMAISVAKYGGFYVGRYEVSFNESRQAQSKGSAVEPYVYSAINSTTSTNNNNATDWYGLYELCKTYNTSSVKSSMIWGSQYDAMLIWMGSEATSFDTSKRNTDTERKTGSVTTDVIKNVYDLSGNSDEWTQEGQTSVRTARGYTMTSRYTSGAPNHSDGRYSSRLALYIL